MLENKGLQLRIVDRLWKNRTVGKAGLYVLRALAAGECERHTARRKGIESFVAVMQELQSMAAADERPDVILESVLERTGTERKV